jgi:hypothetical protein
MSPSLLVSPLVLLLPMLLPTKKPFCEVFETGDNVHSPMPKPPLSPSSHAV